MDDIRKPLFAVLGPILGAILLLWAINLGVNQVRSSQEEFNRAAREERLLQAAQPAEGITQTETVTATDTVTAAQSVTATEAVTAAESVTATESVSAAAEITATEAVTATGALTEPAATQP